MQHTRQQGIDVIEALESLGLALGYTVQREHLVGRSAAVDLSWTAADFNDVPLFVFEVESTASTGIASNALKVYGRDSDELIKPLFFFHLVLKGTPGNERILNAQNMWGRHNYKLYRFSASDQRVALVADVLRQHRRVRNELRLLDVAEVLSESIWGGRELTRIMMDLAQDLRFDASFLHAYACLSIHDQSYAIEYARRLRKLSVYSEENENAGTRAEMRVDRDTYLGGPGDYIPGMIEIALRIHAKDISDADGPDAFERWATRSFGLRTIDAAFGLSREYDIFVIGVAPTQYALVGALLRAFPCSRDWILRDLARLIDRERDRPLPADMRLPAVIWLAHLLSATQAGSGTQLSEIELNRMFEALADHVNEAGGVPSASLARPPQAFGEVDDESMGWLKSSERIPLPDRAAIAQQRRPSFATTGEDDFRPSIAALCFLSLVDDRAYQRPTSELLGLVHGDTP
jgi:hypothetical protein